MIVAMMLLDGCHLFRRWLAVKILYWTHGHVVAVLVGCRAPPCEWEEVGRTGCKGLFVWKFLTMFKWHVRCFGGCHDCKGSSGVGREEGAVSKEVNIIHNIGRRQHVSKEYATISYNRMMCWHERSMDNQGNWHCASAGKETAAYLSFFSLPESNLFTYSDECTNLLPPCKKISDAIYECRCRLVQCFACRESSFLPGSSEVGRRSRPKCCTEVDGGALKFRQPCFVDSFHLNFKDGFWYCVPFGSDVICTFHLSSPPQVIWWCSPTYGATLCCIICCSIRSSMVL